MNLKFSWIKSWYLMWAFISCWRYCLRFHLTFSKLYIPIVYHLYLSWTHSFFGKKIINVLRNNHKQHIMWREVVWHLERQLKTWILYVRKHCNFLLSQSRSWNQNFLECLDPKPSSFLVPSIIYLSHKPWYFLNPKSAYCFSWNRAPFVVK